MRSIAKIDYESELVVGLIPARWKSTRFEGKPLVDICDIPMIKRVYDRACMAKELDTVVVLTDDSRISNYCSKQEKEHKYQHMNRTMKHKETKDNNKEEQ